MKLEGANWTSSGIAVNDGDAHALQSAYIVWSKTGGPGAAKGTVNLPVYLNHDRANVLFSVDLEMSGCGTAEVAQRGVCLTAL